MSEPQQVSRSFHPSEQDLAIYERLLIQGLSLEEVTYQTGFSPQVINAIADKVALWVTLTEQPESPDVARSVHLRRLEYQWQEAMDAWRRSRQNEETLKAVIEEGSKERKRKEKTERTCSGDIRFLWHARKLLQEILALKTDSYAIRVTSSEQRQAIDCERTEIRALCIEVGNSPAEEPAPSPSEDPESPPPIPEP